uniref:Probable deoxycytidylate deaminase n=1 Tax=Meloidogyne enterolobii TaxID=390850 RepID=A0A6V7V365_MELEN|nr:unnamed protein product [Meloidogyne enterolobii]
MTELDKRATEETLKFISELVNQQQKPTESPQPCSSSNDWQNNNLIYSQNLKGNELNVKNEGINSCPISSPIGINFNNNFDYNQNSILAFNKVEPFEGSGLSFNGYMSGLLEGNHSIQNGSVHSDLKTKCLLDNNNQKRSDYLNWEEFFMGSAILASLRSKDPCTQVGACIVKENKIVGTGYNGMPNGCNDDDMPWGKDSSDMFNTKYLYVCHAEMNAIANGNSAQFKDATIYITRFPCNECAKLIIQSGIKTVIYLKDKDCIETRASKRLFDATKVNYSQFQPIRSQIVINFD